MAVLHEVQFAHPVHVDRRHRLAAALGGGDPLPAGPDLARGRAEAAVELAAPVDRSHDRVERDRLQAEIVLAAPSKGLYHLFEGEDEVDIARLAA
jgi:hypothetical protein